jgi:hypothetical protein
MNYEDNNEGALFAPRADERVIRSGRVTIDGQKRGLMIVQKKLPDGNTVYEVFQSVGKIDTQEVEEGSSKPAIKGWLDSELGGWWLSGWKNRSQAGNDYTKVKFEPKPPRDANVARPPLEDGSREQRPPSSDFDDEIPF